MSDLGDYNTKAYSVLMSIYAFDHLEHVKVAVESMLSQTVTPEQFIIVEDGTIGTDLEKMIREYESKYPQLFTVIRLKENKGLGNALNQGLSVCRNELVARMDADDISCPERCEKQLKRFREEPELCILGTQINEFIGDVGNVVSKRIVPCDYDAIKKFSRTRSPFNHPTVMYKRSVILKLGGYVALKRKEDLLLFIEAINQGYYCENLQEVLLNYRISKDNQKRRKTWINCKEYIQVMWGFYKKGYCRTRDIAWVIVGQLMMFLLPISVSEILNQRFLRTKSE